MPIEGGAESTTKLTKEEINAKISSGELNPVKNAADRKLITEALSNPSNSEAKPEAQNIPVTPEAPSAETPSIGEPAVKGETPEVPPETPPIGGDGAVRSPGSEPWRGYNNEDDFRKGFDNLKKLAEAQKETIDKINAANGKDGLALKKAMEEKEALEKKLSVLQESQTSTPQMPQPKTEMPVPTSLVAPSPPVLEEGEDRLDDTYRMKEQKYMSELETYNKNIATALISTQRSNKALEEQIQSVSQFVTEEKKNKALSVQERNKKQFEAELGVLYTEVESLQIARPELKTITPLRQITDIVKSYGNDEASQALLEKHLDTLPAGDKEKYQEVVAISSLYKPSYDSNEGTFKKALANIDEAYLLRKLRSGSEESDRQKHAQEIIEAERKGRQQALSQINGQGAGATELSPAQMGGEALAQMSAEDKKTRLAELNTIAKTNPMGFRNNPTLMEERNKIIASMGIVGGQPKV